MQRKVTRARVIAERIRDHLRRFESDPAVNIRGGTGLQPYYCPSAYPGPKCVHVCYISFQGHSKLTLEEAEAYLSWLDAGNVGTHQKQQSEHPQG